MLTSFSPGFPLSKSLSGLTFSHRYLKWNKSVDCVLDNILPDHSPVPDEVRDPCLGEPRDHLLHLRLERVPPPVVVADVHVQEGLGRHPVEVPQTVHLERRHHLGGGAGKEAGLDLRRVLEERGVVAAALHHAFLKGVCV